MANYLLLYHGGGAPEGAEAQAQVMDDWTKWFGSLGAAVVDGGNPTGVAKTVSSDGSVSDGGGSNPVTGYSVITADNLDAAVEMAKGCPHVTSGGSIEVAETFAVM
ncbi:MAG TPA: hypothetical protein VM848_08140 [Acidimicrobiia bacterium]|nr:hypothetical protein [Acidimicrobiia bacterium]